MNWGPELLSTIEYYFIFCILKILFKSIWTSLMFDTLTHLENGTFYRGPPCPNSRGMADGVGTDFGDPFFGYLHPYRLMYSNQIRLDNPPRIATSFLNPLSMIISFDHDEC